MRREPSISSSVSICTESSLSLSSSLGICKYGISSTIFLILSIVSATSSFSVASMICCIPFAISSCKFTVLNFSAVLTATGGIETAACTNSPAFFISSSPICVYPSLDKRKARYFSSCAFVNG